MAGGNKFELFEKKMRAEGLSEAAVDAFRYNYQQLVEGVTGMVRGRTVLQKVHARCTACTCNMANIRRRHHRTPRTSVCL